MVSVYMRRKGAFFSKGKEEEEEKEAIVTMYASKEGVLLLGGELDG